MVDFSVGCVSDANAKNANDVSFWVFCHTSAARTSLERTVVRETNSNGFIIVRDVMQCPIWHRTARCVKT
jgi:hypothetical protein